MRVLWGRGLALCGQCMVGGTQGDFLSWVLTVQVIWVADISFCLLPQARRAGREWGHRFHFLLGSWAWGVALPGQHLEARRKSLRLPHSSLPKAPCYSLSRLLPTPPLPFF